MSVSALIKFDSLGEKAGINFATQGHSSGLNNNPNMYKQAAEMRKSKNYMTYAN